MHLCSLIRACVPNDWVELAATFRRSAQPARNLDDLRRVVRMPTGKGVRVEFVKESLTFTGEDAPMATLLLSVMGAVSQPPR